MKKLISILLVICVLVGVAGAFSASASPMIISTEVSSFEVWPTTITGTSSHSINIPRGATLIVLGDLRVGPYGSLNVDGCILVFGRFVNNGIEITGRNAWQLNAFCRFIVRYLMGGWFWVLLFG